MSRKRKFISKYNKKSQKSIIYILVEGETEKKFIQYLKSKYRKNLKLKIEKKNKMAMNIETYINNYCIQNSIDKNELYLIYDLENSKTEYNKFIVNGKLKNENTYLSQPCIEYYFLLHFSSFKATNQTTCFVECLEKELDKLVSYKKGNTFQWNPTIWTKEMLDEGKNRAIKSFRCFEDKSFSTIGHFIQDVLEKEETL